MRGWRRRSGRRAGARRSRLACGAAVGLVAVGLSGCGSYTRHDFLQRAAGICDSTTRALRLLPQPQASGDQSARLTSLATYLRRAIPLVAAEVRKLTVLRRPSQTATQKRALEHYLGALSSTVDELGALGAAARSGNGQLVAADEQSLAAAQLPQLAAASGLQACSNPAASYT